MTFADIQGEFSNLDSLFLLHTEISYQPSFRLSKEETEKKMESEIKRFTKLYERCLSGKATERTYDEMESTMVSLIHYIRYYKKVK